MNRLGREFLAGAIFVVVALAAGANVCDAEVTIFLSDKGHGEGATLGNPDVTLPSVGATDSLYVWIRPDDDPNKTLMGVGLDVQSDDVNVLDRTASTVFNPDIYVFSTFDMGDRWNTPVADGNGHDLAFKMVGRAVDQEGINPAHDGTGDPPILDLLYDSGPDAFLFAKIDFQATAVGSTDLWIVVNRWRIYPHVISWPDMDIVFGAEETTILHGDDEYVRSAVRDGTVTVLPDPATLALLIVGGLALTRRRRRG